MQGKRHLRYSGEIEKKRNDKEHHEKASFFHTAEFLKSNFCFLFFEKMSS